MKFLDGSSKATATGPTPVNVYLHFDKFQKSFVIDSPSSKFEYGVLALVARVKFTVSPSFLYFTHETDSEDRFCSKSKNFELKSI